ncbi:CAAX prenyl protease 2 [Termitomyces sp. T112]|nr:CAAX prenyl protease 2 [Termitomyces sp. T112]
MPLVFDSPPISTATAHLLTFIFGFIYVGSLYVSKHGRLSFSQDRAKNANGTPYGKLQDERWRDDPSVIRARFLAGTIATILNCGLVFYILWSVIDDRSDRFKVTLETTVARLGFNIYHLDMDMILPHLVTPVLFTGPLFGMYLGGHLPFQSRFYFQNDVVNKFTSWVGIRNYIMAPITEEIVFRSCVIAVYHMSGASANRMIFFGPLSFGLAHVHHAWDTYNRFGRTASAAKRAITMSLFQLAYTTLFGFHCSYMFLRTGSVYPSITAHIFCNIMGLPEISWELRTYSTRRTAILLMYTLGIVGFALVLGPWTRLGGMYTFWSARPYVNMSY